MIRHIYISFIVAVSACGTISTDNNRVEIESEKMDPISSLHSAFLTDDLLIEEEVNYDNAIYYIVVADTSLDYYVLHKKMFELNRKLNIPIDTMGRYYNKSKNLIALPDDDEDELYAGEYFARRFPSQNLSLEYLDTYQDRPGSKTIALVSGIYETEESADSALTVIKKSEKKAYKIKAEIFVGCLR